MPRIPPPLKITFEKCREREFLYLPEVDAIVAAMEQTRYLTLCCHFHERIMEEKRRKQFEEHDRAAKSCKNSQIRR
jgi:hypothetical protein